MFHSNPISIFFPYPSFFDRAFALQNRVKVVVYEISPYEMGQPFKPLIRHQ